ncbi:hypothetical protein OCK74_03385 [Chitinophagaceae bacterium LB-8]|uniref:Uncharacterized protein n=1 Tax=Paraflavisolibacter caeni TaxID=2982496 RepID=A0A9X3BGP6_9BACT|nr:hypothetical protein [Paraflavisolibacter caeni]MCU7548137.1 hypothetical protein [Paraflavisolibacter caeni]
MINEQLILKLMSYINRKSVIGLMEEGFPEFTREENDQIPELCFLLRKAGFLDSKHKNCYFLTPEGEEALKRKLPIG